MSLLHLPCNTLLACKPANIDWDAFFQHYDKNHNQLIQFKEFKLIKDFSSYPHPNQTEFQGNNEHQQLFLTLSQNHNDNHNHPLTKKRTYEDLEIYSKSLCSLGRFYSAA